MEKGLKRSCVMMVVAFLAMVHVSVSVPFIILHEIGTQCSDATNANFTQLLTNLSGSPGFCLEIGNGISDSWLMPLTRQAEIACDNVKQMQDLSQGYNIVGRAQGNLVARGLIEFCDDGPPVHNYVSLAGPHAGIAVLPRCTRSGLLCDVANGLGNETVYSDFVQDNLAPSGYFKDPKNVTEYLKGCKYLPKLNNERPADQRNQTYKDRFTSLQKLVFVLFQNDTVIVPKESSWFGFYPDGDFTHVLPVSQTKLYIEDWIGLKALALARKVQLVIVPGAHLIIADEDLVNYVVPLLEDQVSAAPRLNRKTKEPLHP
ncbi:Alpha/Beta hydrolase fold [Arabidopsis suecica]|uniref:Alpha/Beta hydrolase fold n=1 Tax=Arabidopsis suecica TaxID=45249 RepID=A0A8T1XPZ3_ARASU|nr:Alpha/Beta hydrolase fold [Arabidopsis suecica]